MKRIRIPNPVIEVAGQKYSVDKKLMANWNKIKDGKLKKLDEDRVYIVDGQEGAGKSLWAMQQAGAIDPTLFEDALRTKKLPHICFTGEETLYAIRHTKSTDTRTRVIIFDEAFRGLSARSTLSKINGKIIQVLMEMRQNNLVLFIVLPSFTMLDRYAVMNRGKTLFHIHKPMQRGNQKVYYRSFYIYNYALKGKLCMMDKKVSWNYPIRSRVHGKFYNKYPGGPEFEKLYRHEKELAFKEVGRKLEGETDESRQTLQRNMLLLLLKEKYGAKWTEIEEFLNHEETKLDKTSMSRVYKQTKKFLRAQKTS